MGPARHLSGAAIGAFLHSLDSLKVAGVIAFGGATMAAILLPSRPAPTPSNVEEPVVELTALETRAS